MIPSDDQVTMHAAGRAREVKATPGHQTATVGPYPESRPSLLCVTARRRATGGGNLRGCPSGFFWRGAFLTAPSQIFLSPAPEIECRGRGRKRKTSARGYGSAHQKLRKQLAPEVEAGGVRCWRCGDPIRPGERWDLGHDDHDRNIYRGPEHVACNRSTANRKRWRSREW